MLHKRNPYYRGDDHFITMEVQEREDAREA